jgi:hypothetical protein
MAALLSRKAFRPPLQEPYPIGVAIEIVAIQATGEVLRRDDEMRAGERRQHVDQARNEAWSISIDEEHDV